jgi:hypothetical protein
MFGDFILFIKRLWKEFWCIHEYTYHTKMIPYSDIKVCAKCARIK